MSAAGSGSISPWSGRPVNETSQIAAMCRSVEQPVLVSEASAKVDGMRPARPVNQAFASLHTLIRPAHGKLAARDASLRPAFRKSPPAASARDPRVSESAS